MQPNAILTGTKRNLGLGQMVHAFKSFYSTPKMSSEVLLCSLAFNIGLLDPPCKGQFLQLSHTPILLGFAFLPDTNVLWGCWFSKHHACVAKVTTWGNWWSQQSLLKEKNVKWHFVYILDLISETSGFLFGIKCKMFKDEVYLWKYKNVSIH